MRTSRARRATTAVIAVCALAATLVACAPEPEEDAPGALSVQVEGAKPTVEPVALDDDVAAGISELGKMGGFLVGAPMSIELEGELPEAGATLTRSYAEPLPDDAAATFAYWDEEFRTWVAVPSTLSADRTTITAHVHHFSIWTDFVAGSQQTIRNVRDAAADAGQAVSEWVDGVVETGSEALHWSLGNIFAKRVELPECDLPTPNWVIDLPVGTGVDDPVRFCAGYDAANPGLLVVKARSNRGYGFPAVLSVPPAWEYNSTAENTVGDLIDTVGNLDQAVGQVVAELWSDGRYVGPGEEISFGIPASALRDYDSEFLLELAAPTFGQFVSSTAAQQLVAWGASPLEGNLAAVIAVASCWSSLSSISDIGQGAAATLTCITDADDKIAGLLGQAFLAGGMQENAAGRLAGTLIGRLSVYMALLPAGISTLDYAAEVNLPRSARSLTIDANPSLATELGQNGSLPDAAMWLWEFPVVKSTQTSGEKETAQYYQDGRLIEAPNSTNIWVGCTSAGQVTVFDIDSSFTTANLLLAVQAHAPAALTVNVRVTSKTGGGEVIDDETFTIVQGMDPVAAEIQLADHGLLEVLAQTDDACGPAKKGYVSLVQSYVY